MILRHVVLLAAVLFSFSVKAVEKEYSSGLRTDTSPETLYTLALQNIELGYYELALGQLERVVLMNPKHAGAWMDLAVMSFELGEDTAARHYLQHIQQTFNPPPSLQMLIDNMLDEMQQRIWVMSGELSALAGYSTNANGGASDDILSLTTPAGRLQFELADSELEQAAGFSEIGGQWQYLRSTGGWRPGFLLAASTRVYEKELGNQHHALGLARLESDFGSVGSLAVYVVPQSGRTYWRFGQWVEFQLPKDLAINFNYRQDLYSTNAQLDTQSYATTLKYQTGSLSLALKLAREEAKGSRAGGDRNTVEWSTGYAFPALRGRLALRYVGELTRDQEGYNPLMQNNQKRQLTRHELELDWRRQLSDALELRVSGQHYRQYSNLDLFDTAGTTVAVGMNWQW